MALDKTKTDYELGNEIHELLKERGVETPMLNAFSDKTEEKISVIEEHFSEIMKTLGLDLSDDSLSETPRRVAKMFVNEVYWGLNYSNFPKITTIDNKMNYNTMLLERNISLKSSCEHHFLPFIGVAHIAYIPDSCIIGISKLNRIVEFFSRRPQVQERLTEQIFHALIHILGTEDIAVCIKAEHSCVKLRGVEDINSDTVTTKLGGAFLKNENTRNEFFHSIRL